MIDVGKSWTAYTPPKTAPSEPPIGAPAEKVAKAVLFACEGANEEPRIPSAEGCRKMLSVRSELKLGPHLTHDRSSGVCAMNGAFKLTWNARKRSMEICSRGGHWRRRSADSGKRDGPRLVRRRPRWTRCRTMPFRAGIQAYGHAELRGSAILPGIVSWDARCPPADRTAGAVIQKPANTQMTGGVQYQLENIHNIGRAHKPLVVGDGDVYETASESASPTVAHADDSRRTQILTNSLKPDYNGLCS